MTELILEIGVGQVENYFGIALSRKRVASLSPSSPTSPLLLLERGSSKREERGPNLERN
jgi:hypothetical protein